MGWTIGQNVRIDTRWATANAAAIRRHAAELAAIAPDVILAHGSSMGPLMQVTRTVPIVFSIASDPVGAGYVDSLPRPGGNATGFMSYEYSMGGKRLELLKQIAPGVTRAAVLRDATQGSGTSEFAAIQAVAPSFGVEVHPVNMRDAGETEGTVAAFARSQLANSNERVDGLLFARRGSRVGLQEENGKAAANIAGGHPATRSNRLPVAVVGWMLSQRHRHGGREEAHDRHAARASTETFHGHRRGRRTKRCESSL